MKTLSLFSEIVNWAVLVFIFMRVINTTCFNNTDWILTLIAVAFSYFIKYVSKYEEEHIEEV